MQAQSHGLYTFAKHTLFKCGKYSGACKFVNPVEFSIFIQKFELKNHQIFSQVQKVDKENQAKQILNITYV